MIEERFIGQEKLDYIDVLNRALDRINTLSGTVKSGNAANFYFAALHMEALLNAHLDKQYFKDKEKMFAEISKNMSDRNLTQITAWSWDKQGPEKNEAHQLELGLALTMLCTCFMARRGWQMRREVTGEDV